MNRETLNLIQRYADGVATADEVAVLQTILAEDASVRTSFLDFMNLDESLGAIATLEAVSQEENRSDLGRVQSAKTPLFPRSSVALAFSAAALLLCCGILWLNFQSNYWATVTKTGAGVSIVGADWVARPAVLGDRLRSGDFITTSVDSDAKMKVKGLGTVMLGPDTKLVRARDPRSLRLASGFVEIEAEKQKPGKPWRIQTAEAEAAVMGTRFSLASANGRTAMRVEEGLVQLTALQSGQSENVKGGNRAFVVGSRSPAVARTRPGSVLLMTSREAEPNWPRFNQLIGDRFVDSRLWQLGFKVDVRHFDEVQPEDLEDRALVIVSIFAYGVGEPAIEALGLAKAPVPVLCLEPAGYPVLRMTGEKTVGDHGFTTTSPEAEIVNSKHPLAAGLTGSSAHLRYRMMGWGRPGPGAAVIAQLPGQPERAVLFAYDFAQPLVPHREEQATLAPARRVGLFLDPIATTSDATDGWKLFEAAVDWCVSADK